ncbi:unnamed protein product [Darwinula stevensoni]|uniref:Uncharacterized protein n=1 Tax=Darwinula stevensoni TaxID=69355 RepID=A0A7R8XBL5_9CRUS|nr:unnamed protein product [Darwinula stevensoni]CAG0891132.1 unnamed protein product [Darwinula stevensoni]
MLKDRTDSAEKRDRSLRMRGTVKVQGIKDYGKRGKRDRRISVRELGRKRSEDERDHASSRPIQRAILEPPSRSLSDLREPLSTATAPAFDDNGSPFTRGKKLDDAPEPSHDRARDPINSCTALILIAFSGFKTAPSGCILLLESSRLGTMESRQERGRRRPTYERIEGMNKGMNKDRLFRARASLSPLLRPTEWPHVPATAAGWPHVPAASARGTPTKRTNEKLMRSECRSESGQSGESSSSSRLEYAAETQGFFFPDLHVSLPMSPGAGEWARFKQRNAMRNEMQREVSLTLPSVRIPIKTNVSGGLRNPTRWNPYLIRISSVSRPYLVRISSVSHPCLIRIIRYARLRFAPIVRFRQRRGIIPSNGDLLRLSITPTRAGAGRDPNRYAWTEMEFNCFFPVD